MKKNVLQFIGSFHQGGSERQAIQLAKLLREDGSVNVFVATLNKEGVLLDEMTNKGFLEIPEFKLTSFFNLHFLKQIRNCAKFLRENKIDVVHTHDFYTNVFGILSAKYAKTPIKIASKRETSGFRSAMQKRIENFIFKIADGIVVNSKAIKNFLVEQNVSAKNIRVVYNGLDLERLKPSTTNHEEICQEFGLPTNENARFITHVANLHHPVKNQEMFLQAMQKVVQEFPNVHAVFAGEGERKAELEQLAEDLKVRKNVHFIGLCRKVPELLFISEICVLTSFAEGFSNSILEYMSASKPVVATDVGGAKEAITEGETGFLIESNDDSTLANRLKILLKNPEKAKEFGKKGRKIVEEKFSTKRQTETTLKFYDSF